MVSEAYLKEKRVRIAIEEYAKEQAIAEGLAEGLERGLKQGIERGLKQGIEQGIEQEKAHGIQLLILDNLEDGKSKDIIIAKLAKH